MQLINNESDHISSPTEASNQSPAHHQGLSASETTVLSPASASIDSLIQPPPKRRRKGEDTPPISDINVNEPSRINQDPNRYYVVREHTRRFGNQNHVGSPDVPEPVKRRVYAEYQRIEDSNAAQVPHEELLSPAIWKNHFVWPNHLTTTQCTCLMRYYIDHLGPWVRHYPNAENYHANARSSILEIHREPLP